MTITTQSDDPRLARQIQELRFRGGWRSQVVAARAAGVSRDKWQRLETHGWMPGSNLRARISLFLGLRWDTLERYAGGEIEDITSCHTSTDVRYPR